MILIQPYINQTLYKVISCFNNTSSNLISNEEFTEPITTTDSFTYITDFTIDQENNFY